MLQDVARRVTLGLTFLVTVSFCMVGTVRAAELHMFESPGCAWCKRWHAEVGPGYPKSSEGLRAPLQLRDVARSSGAGILLAQPITVSPTFVLVENGREIGRIVGYPGAGFFWGLLVQLVAKMDRATALPQGRFAKLHISQLSAHLFTC